MKKDYDIFSNNPNSELAARFRSLFFKTAALFVVFIGFLYLIYNNRIKENAAYEQLQHANEILLRSEETISFVKDYETASRGYVISGNNIFIDSLGLSRNRIARAVNYLRFVVSSVHFQPGQIDSLQHYINKRMEFSDTTISLRKNGNARAASNLVASGLGKRYMDTVRSIISNIKTSAVLLRNTRLEQQKKASSLFIVSVAGSLLAFFLFLIILFRQAWNNLKHYYEHQRQTNKALSQLAAGLLKAQQIGSIGSWERIIDTGVEQWSAELYRILGIETSTIGAYQPDFEKMIHPDDKIAVSQILKNAIADKKSFYCQCKILLLSGEKKHIKLNGKIYPVEGYGLAVGGTIQDVTQEYIAQSEKEELAQLLARTNAIANIGWWLADINFHFIKWSEVTKKLLEMPDEYEPGFDSFLNYIADFDNRKVFFEAYQNALNNNQPFDLIVPFTTAKKTLISVRVIGEPTVNENGHSTKIFGFFQLLTS